MARANAALASAGRPTIPAEATFHSLRRTYASLMAEQGVHPAYTMRQIGHRNAKLTLEVYTDVANRALERGGLGRLLDSSDWAPLGTTGESGVSANVPDAFAAFPEPWREQE